MKRLYGITLLLFTTINLFSQTDVSGNQSGTWTTANSPYNVTGNITIPSGETLTIESGITVNFQGHYKITVLGILSAEGTKNDGIIFTADNHTTGWGGISLGQSVSGNVTPADGVSYFSYCNFEYGKTSGDEYPDTHGGAVRMINSDAVFENCVFSNNSSVGGEGMGGAVYAINTGSAAGAVTKFTDCEFTNNTGYSEGGAIKFTSDFNTEITGCKFINNTTNYGGGAIMFYSVVDTKMIKCLFAGNSTIYDNGGAFKTLGSDNSLFFKNCTIVGNEASGGSGGALALYYGSADFVNCIVYDNVSQYDDDNVYIDAGTGTGTVNYCNMIMPDYNTTGANNMETDPLFADAAGGDYHLSENSPCINAGTDIGLEYVGDAPDMGCYEYGMSESIYSSENNDFVIYPNPANEYVEIPGFNIDETVVFDLSGREILKEKGKNIINVSGLFPGIYFMKIKIKDNIISKKFIKE